MSADEHIDPTKDLEAWAAAYKAGTGEFAYRRLPCDICGKPQNEHRYSRYTSPTNGCPSLREPSIEVSFDCPRCGVNPADGKPGHRPWKYEPITRNNGYCADCVFESGTATPTETKHAACRDGKCWQCGGMLTPPSDQVHESPCSDCQRKNIDARRFRQLDLEEQFYEMYPERLPVTEPFIPPLSNCIVEHHDVDLAAEGEAIAKITAVLQTLPEISMRRVLSAIAALTAPFGTTRMGTAPSGAFDALAALQGEGSDDEDGEPPAP